MTNEEPRSGGKTNQMGSGVIATLCLSFGLCQENSIGSLSKTKKCREGMQSGMHEAAPRQVTCMYELTFAKLSFVISVIPTFGQCCTIIND